MLWNLLLIVLAIQVGLPLLLFLGKNKLMYFPSSAPTAAESVGRMRGVSAEPAAVRRPDGRELPGIDARPRGQEPDAGGPVILFLHGNAGNVGLRAELLAWFVEESGVRTLLAEYSGFGGADGSPSEETICADALAAFDHLVAGGISPQRIVLYGESIGGGAAAYVATERECGGLILQSTISSLPSAALAVYPWLPLTALLSAGGFPTADRVAALDCPVLLVHGTADRIVPFAQSEKIRAAAPSADLWPIDDAGHNDLFSVGGSGYLQRIGETVRGWVGK